MRLHIALAVLVPVCVALCVWQVNRALSGNDLSWAYVFEWPFFAGYGIYMWWRLVHEQFDSEAASATGTAPTDPASPATDAPGAPDEADEELAAYNRYLAQLHQSGRQKRW
jgi:hypothetical protein